MQDTDKAEFELEQFKPKANDMLSEANQKILAVRHIPATVALLQFTGFTGISTHIQCLDYLRPNWSVYASLWYIKYAIRQKYLFELPVGGKNKGARNQNRGPIIFYLSEAGYKYVRWWDKEMATHLVYGRPDVSQKNDLLHELLISGSLVHWNREHDIGFLKNARQLRGEKMKGRWDWRKGALPSYPASDDSLGDYKIGIHNRQTGKTDIHNCEAMVKYHRSVVVRKSRPMKWFATSVYQLGKINVLTGQDGFVINPLQEKIDPSITNTIRNTLLGGRMKSEEEGVNLLAKNILDEMKRTNLTMSINELRLLVPDDVHSLARARKTLIEAKLVKTMTNTAYPARGAGRPPMFIFLPQNEQFLAVQGFRRHMILAEVFRIQMLDNWTFIDFDPVRPALTMEDPEGERIAFLSDFKDREHITSTIGIHLKFVKFRDTHDCRAVLVIVDKPRLDSLSDALSKEEIFDLTDNFAQIRIR